MNLREEYRTGSIRGLMAGAFAAAVAFFTNWTGDTSTQELIRETALAGLLAGGPFLGFGAYDARRTDRARAREQAPTEERARAHDDPPPGEAGKALDWHYMAGYAILGLGILMLELFGVFNDSPGDTISEATWNVLDWHPLFWWVGLGMFGGFVVWLTRHFWWHKK